MSRNEIARLGRAIAALSSPKLGRSEVFRKRLSEAQAIQRYNHEYALLFFQESLRLLPDPRRRQGTRYPLQTIIVIALMAVICDNDDAQSMELWGKQHEDWLSTILEMPHGAPTQDVYLKVLGALDPAAFSRVFCAWAELVSMQLKGRKRQICVDGKTNRRTYDTGKGILAIHIVSAWCREAGIVIGQTKTSEKSNEITAIPELLHKLDIRNALITIDAMGCQTDIADIIIHKGADYLLAVKKNQPSLYHDIETAFRYADTCRLRTEQNLGNQLPPPSIETHFDVDKGHGRLEERTVDVSRDLIWLSDHIGKWAKLAYMVRVTRVRTRLINNKTTTETVYYIGSDSNANIQSISDSIRGHWSIENSLHWVLDMAFREDDARHRAGNTAENLAILRHFALCLIKQDKDRPAGVKNCRKMAGWSPKYLIKLLIESGGKVAEFKGRQVSNKKAGGVKRI